MSVSSPMYCLLYGLCVIVCCMIVEAYLYVSSSKYSLLCIVCVCDDVLYDCEGPSVCQFTNVLHVV